MLKGSIDGGLRNPPVRWLMLAAPFTVGVGIYAFYAFQPYLLQLYGDPTAYGVAGLAAAVIAGAQIVGGLTCRGSAGCSGAGRTRCSRPACATVVLLALVGLTSASSSRCCCSSPGR